MKHWYCEELNTGDSFLVYASNLFAAYRIAKEVGADFSCGCEKEPDIYVCPTPLTEEEAEASGLDEY